MPFHRKSATFAPISEELKRTGLTTHQAADKVGRSVAWVKSHATDLGGVVTRNGYRFPAEISLERVSEKITLRTRMTSPSVVKEERDGQNARKVFELLDKGVPTREIVKQTSLPAKRVLDIAKEWIACGLFDQNELAIVHDRRRPAPPSLPGTPGTMVVFSPPPVETISKEEMTPEEQNLIPVKRESVRERIAILRREIETGAIDVAPEGETT